MDTGALFIYIFLNFLMKKRSENLEDLYLVVYLAGMNTQWKNQIKDSVRSVHEAAELLGVELPQGLYNVEGEYPVMISPHYFELIDKTDPLNDPIWKICMPDNQELLDKSSDFDPLAEEEQMAVPRLIHRYDDRVVMLTTNRCPMLCRFCFRKRKWKNGSKWSDISESELEAICDYLKLNPQVREVLISGGDPLMLETGKLKVILDKLSAVESIDVIRIATRMPVTLPMRIDDELMAVLSKYPQLWLVTHFNHPKELTKESLEACRRITQAGIPALNQTVLLKGVNDSSEVLEELFRGLIKNRIKPHYLFHVDPVRGVKHFATGIEAGLDIIKSFRKGLSSLAVPHFAIDLPEGGGKVALQPDYTDGGNFKSISDTSIRYY